MNSAPKTFPASGGAGESQPAVQEIRWGDFRDHLPTAEKNGKRKWVYPKKVSGPWFKRRTWFSWFLLAVMFVGPVVKINGNPLLMINVVERKFSILGQIFWPQDMIIFTVAMLVFLASIIVFTTAFGRLWCGWACPQTVLMEMLFRRIEHAIEGDARDQKALDRASWNRTKLFKKISKHFIFALLSLVISNWLLAYIIGYEDLLEIITDDPRQHLTGLGFMVAFTIVFYLIFARFREQACTFICPYGRFMSATLDENTMVVAYDYKRGEKRATLNRRVPFDARRAEGFGDCVNCRECVSVCPTGIDIRNGTQMECINCTACIDACDRVMTKIGRPAGLIRYASLNSIERGEKFRFTTRMRWNGIVLTALVVLFGVLLFTRSELESTVLRAPGALFQVLPGNKISNLYTVKTINKSSCNLTIEFRLENFPADVKLMGASTFSAPKETIAQTSMLITADRDSLTSPKTKLRIAVFGDGKHMETINTVFIGPRTR